MSAARSEIITIKLGGEDIAVELSRKRIGGMNLRVSAGGEVRASAPLGTPTLAVKAFIQSRSAWLASALARQSARQSAAPPPDDIRGGGHIRLFGESVPIITEQAKKTSVALEGEALVARVRDINDPETVKKAVEKWRRAEAARYLAEITAGLLPQFARYRLKMPSITIKRMKTRWGSCSTTKAHVNYNIMLLSAPPEAARYVAAHELAHFVVPRHDRAFYAVVAEVMPDWKRCKALLKSERII